MPIKALYVDDEQALLDLTKLFLEQSREIEVECASCVGEAEKKLLEQEYDVIISDYQMPGTNGIEFLKRLRSYGCRVPFILYTGRGREEVAIEALNSGADFYMQKGGAPKVQFAELENYVKQSAHRYQSERATLESEEHFRCLVDNSFEGVGVHIDKVLIEANNAFCEITGYAREELIGKRMEDLYTEPSWKMMMGRLSDPIAEPYDVQIVRKDGMAVNVKTRGKNIAWKGRIARLSTILDLSERRNMEERLLEREGLIQNLVETSPDIVWEVDLRGILTYISPRVTDILGYRQTEVMGSSIFSLVPLPSLRCTEDGFIDRLHDRREFTTRIDIKHKSGEALLIEIRAAPYLDALGRLKGFRGIGRILPRSGNTEKRCAECLFTRRSFDTSPLGILIFDQDGFLADMNPASMALFGIVEKWEVIGSPLQEHLGSEDLSRLREGKIIRFTAPYRGRMVFRSALPDGSDQGAMMDISVVPHHGPDGSLIGYEMHARITDEDTALASEAKNALLSAVLDNSGDANVFVLDRSYRYLAYNKHHAEIIRRIWGAEIAIGDCMLDVISKKDDLARAKHNFDVALGGERLTVTEEYGDLSRPVWRDNYSPMRSKTGEVLGVTCHCLDVTDWEQIKRDLEQANHKLRVISGITRHDMLNQLTVIQGYLEMGRRRAAASDMGEMFERMLQVTADLTSQIDQAKEYQDIGSKGPEWQSIAAMCRKAKDRLDLSRVEVSIEAQGLEVYADPLLWRVFYNLMDNSIKHGKSVSRLSIRSEMTDGGLKVIYQDDGVGIDAGMRARLFTEGGGWHHGLGLYLAKEILQITGIRIREVGAADQGARFELAVPPGHFRFVEEEDPSIMAECPASADALLEPQHLGRGDLAGASRRGVDAQQRG